jgi:hypothetical protein
MKQLDDGIANTFVSAMRDEVFFALIDFQDSLDGEKPYASGSKD